MRQPELEPESVSANDTGGDGQEQDRSAGADQDRQVPAAADHDRPAAAEADQDRPAAESEDDFSDYAGHYRVLSPRVNAVPDNNAEAGTGSDDPVCDR